MPTWAKQ